MKNANIGIIPLKLLHRWIDKWIDKSWLVRATTNGIVGFLVGPVLGYTIFAFAVLAAIPFKGLSPGDAIIFCVSLLDFSNPKSARLISYWLIIGVIGLFAATASTPVHRNSPSVKDKYMVRGLASLGAILIPSYIGHLAYKQDFLDCLPLGLFIGLPFTIIASIKFHEIFQRLSQDRL